MSCYSLACSPGKKGAAWTRDAANCCCPDSAVQSAQKKDAEGPGSCPPPPLHQCAQPFRTCPAVCHNDNPRCVTMTIRWAEDVEDEHC